MRTDLGKKYGERERFLGTFSNFGIKSGYKHELTTILFINIKDLHGNLLTDHLWFNFTKEFEDLYCREHLHTGTILSFNARVTSYNKGYTKEEWDYKLSHPRKFMKEGFDETFKDDIQKAPHEFQRREVENQMKEQREMKLTNLNIKIMENKAIGIQMVVDIHKIVGKRPYFDIYIGRKSEHTEFTEDSKWCNPIQIDFKALKKDEKAEKERVLGGYRTYILAKIKEDPITYNIEELRGKMLGCWCITTSEIYPLCCHGQILLELLYPNKKQSTLTEIKTTKKSQIVDERIITKSSLDYFLE